MEIIQTIWTKLRQFCCIAAMPALVLAGCSTAEPQEAVVETTEPAVAQQVEELGEEISEAVEVGETRVIEVEGGSFYYEPNVIRVKKGEPVKIVLNSVDMMHDFVIDELNVKTEILSAGETGEVEFTPDTVGEFEFYCSVGNHRASGMVGTLVVEE